MEKRLKAVEVELAYLRKSIEELKKQRVIEIHYHLTNKYEGYPEDYDPLM